MRHSSTLFLRVIILLIAIGALTGMIRFPQTEGRAANIDLISIYKDPFIIYLYIASIPFFVGLYQSFKLLGYIDKNKIFSSSSLKAVRNIKYCAIALIGFIAAAISYIFVMAKVTNDDGAGAIAVGLVTIIIFGVIAITAAFSQKLVRNEVNKIRRNP